MIYIPTVTSELRNNPIFADYILYSPNKNIKYFSLGSKLTIWDNYTFYLYKRLRKNKEKTAKEHYLWLIDFIQQNWRKGIVLITPDVDWLSCGPEIEKAWKKQCSEYPQLYIPNTWKSDISNLNILGYALRKESENIHHPTWTHCLGHIRNNLNSEIQTYDSVTSNPI